jgi:hypothetical protein
LRAQNFIENFLRRSRANGHDGDKSGPGGVIYCGLPLFRLKREMQISFVPRSQPKSNQASGISRLLTRSLFSLALDAAIVLATHLLSFRRLLTRLLSIHTAEDE